METIQQLDVFAAANNYTILTKDAVLKQWGEPGVRLMQGVLQGFCQALHDNGATILVAVDKGVMQDAEKLQEEIKEELVEQPTTTPTPQFTDDDIARMEAEMIAAEQEQEAAEIQQPTAPPELQRLQETAARMNEQLQKPLTNTTTITTPAPQPVIPSGPTQAPAPETPKRMTWAEKLRAFDASKKRPQQ